MKMSEKIRNIRKLKNFSQEYVASILGYKSFTTIQKWETAVATPPIDKLIELAKIYDVPFTDLLDDNISKELPSTIKEFPDYSLHLKNVLTDLKPITESKKSSQKTDSKIPSLLISTKFLGEYAGLSDLIFIRLPDDSLNLRIPKHSLLTINLKVELSDLTDNDLVLLKYNNNYFFYYYYFYAEHNLFIFKPQSSFPIYTDLIFSSPNDFTILGKVIMYNVVL